MGKVIAFIPKDIDRKLAKRLVDFSQDIDAAVVATIQDGADPKEVAGILAHRLGELLSHLDTKDALWPFYEKLLKRQAKIEDL